MCCNQKKQKKKKKKKKKKKYCNKFNKDFKSGPHQEKKQTLKKGLCGCHFLQEVLQITHIKLDTFLGLLSHPVLIDNTTPLTLKCTCPSASPGHKLPEDRA